MLLEKNLSVKWTAGIANNYILAHADKIASPDKVISFNGYYSSKTLHGWNNIL